MGVKPTSIFGPGQFDAIPNHTYPTPSPFSNLESMSISFKRDLKSLMGRGQFVADVRAGGASINWKATIGALIGRLMSDLVVGAAPNAAIMYNKAKDERQVVNGSALSIVNNHGAAVFVRDCGVSDKDAKQLIRVNQITKPNHYTVTNAGQYRFSVTRKAEPMFISYEWQGNPSGLGAVVPIVNQTQGQVGDFTAVATFENGAEQNVMTLNSALVSDLEMATKNGDFGKPTLSGLAQPDDLGNIGTFSFAQQR